MVLNPDFENQHHTGIPDSHLQIYDEGGSVLSDSRTSVSGYYSLRLIHPGQILKDNNSKNKQMSYRVTGIETYNGLKIEANQTYISSIYIKAKEDQVARVRITTCNWFTEVQVTSEWEPYKLIGKSDINQLCNMKVELLEQGTVWIDLISVQKASSVLDL